LFIVRLICSPLNSDGSPADPSDWIQSLANLSTLDSRRHFSISDESFEFTKKKTLKLWLRIPRTPFRVQDFRNFPKEEWKPKVKSSGAFFLGRHSPA
jgi:hypothetical protein